MIQITPHMRFMVAQKPVDFRKGIDSLVGFCRNVLMSDPFSGFIFIFRNRSKTAIKILMYDGQGFWLCQKRLSQGRFKWWPENKNSLLNQVASHELFLLIFNGNPSECNVQPDWKKITPN